MTKKSLSSSSRAWLKNYHNDPYVKQARKDNYRSRAAYKLLEIQEKTHFLQKNHTVIDLGSSPGSWCQVLVRCLNKSKATPNPIIALDRLPMAAIPGVQFIEGDFEEEVTQNHLYEVLGKKKIDCILSDMAPNTSGIKTADQLRVMGLAEQVLAFVDDHLAPEGSFLIKVFQGSGFDDYIQSMRNRFAKVKVLKPRASKPSSREYYLLGQKYFDKH